MSIAFWSFGFDFRSNVDMSTSNSYSFSLGPGEQQRLLRLNCFLEQDRLFNHYPCFGLCSKPRRIHSGPRQKYGFPFHFKNRGHFSDQVIVSVFDVMGRRVKNIVNDTRYPGNYTVVWNGTDDGNKRLRQGVISCICAPKVFRQR